MEITRRRGFAIVLVLASCFLTYLVSYNHPKLGSVVASLFPRYQITRWTLDQNQTVTCLMPELDPFHHTVKHLYKRLPVPYNCDKKPSFLKITPNATVRLNKNLLWKHHRLKPSNISCTYETIVRNPISKHKPTDDNISYLKSKTLVFDEPLGVDFVLVKCVNSDKTIHEEFLAMTPLKSSVEERLDSRMDGIRLKDRLNIIILGIDSISKLNFIRHFHKTRKLLNANLQSFELHRYNKVADNTFPNLTPLLTGHFVKDYPKDKFFDEIDLIWKHFSNIGYRTLLAEDAPKIATYNYLKKGFMNPPSDYYLRPFSLAVEKSSVKKKSKNHCFGDRMEMKVMFDYVRSFIDTMEDRPYFVFTFVARLTHDVLNYAAYADEPSHEILKYILDSNISNNSLVIFMSDHGLRFGPIRETYIGMFEERWPIMHLTFPKWFLEQFPEIERNLRLNEDKLATPFDVHDTLLDVLQIVSQGEYSSDKISEPSNGISLFQPIPPHRTCEDANIVPHWCTCQSKIPVSVKAKKVRKAADSLVNALNTLISRTTGGCANLSLNKVTDAHFSSPTSGVLDYLLTILVEPSNGIFEGTIRYKDKAFVVLGDISRINHYGSQGSCTEDSDLKKYCYCK